MPDARDLAFDAVGDISRASDEAELRDVIQSYVMRLGFTGYSCSTFHVTAAMASHHILFSTMPERFVRAFSEEGLVVHDPVAKRARNEAEPFYWSREDYDPLIPAHRRIAQLRVEAGVTGGFVAVVACGAKDDRLMLNVSGSAFRDNLGVRTALNVIASQLAFRLDGLRAQQTKAA